MIVPRCHSVRRNTKLSHSSQVVRNSQSRTSCKKKSKQQRVEPEVTSWVSILQQISKVTNKVQKLCSQEKKTQHCRSKAQMKGKIKNLIQGKIFQKNVNLQFNLNQQEEVPQQNYRSSCNPDCHFLMYQCMKLNSENKKLLSEKQQLEKRLYFQSKEKRQLRWKLQKQKEVESYIFHKEQPSNSFTLRQIDTNYLCSGSGFNGLSQSSYMTAKKQSPLKEKNMNIISIQKQNCEPKDDDSLLIDFSERNDSRKNTQKSSDITKTTRYINFQKDLNELLQICKNETDKDKKKTYRKQMKRLAQQIKSLKSE